jgi:hypothetical protein
VVGIVGSEDALATVAPPRLGFRLFAQRPLMHGRGGIGTHRIAPQAAVCQNCAHVGVAGQPQDAHHLIVLHWAALLQRLQPWIGIGPVFGIERRKRQALRQGFLS